MERTLFNSLSWPFQFCMIGPDDLDPTDYMDVILICGKVKFASQTNMKH